MDIKERYNALINAMNENNVDAALQHLHPNCIDHNKMPGMPDGHEGFRAMWQMWMSSFSDVRIKAQQIVAEGNLIAGHLAITAKHTGEFMGVAATNKEVTMTVTEVSRAGDDGRIAERWGTEDLAGLLMQLGVIQPPQ